MQVRIVTGDERLGVEAARIVARLLLKKPHAVLSLAAGRTPLGLYRSLVQLYRQDLLDFSRVRMVNLDEFRGLGPHDSASFARLLTEGFLNHVNASQQNIRLLDGETSDPETECRSHTQMIHQWGGIDLQVLGIGPNGHIGFNEPGCPWHSEASLVNLASETVQWLRTLWGTEQVPTQALTLGIKTIMQARQILLLASGEEKAIIVARALKGPVTAEVPASVLQIHPNVIVLLDKGAAGALSSPSEPSSPSL